MMRLSGAAGVDLLEHLLELLRFGKFLLRDRMDGGFQAFAINLAVHGYPAVKSPRADVSQQVASVAQLVEQLTLNFRNGFRRFFLLFAPVESSYSPTRSRFSPSLALTSFRSKKGTEYTIRDTMERSSDGLDSSHSRGVDADPSLTLNCIPLDPGGAAHQSSAQRYDC